MNKRIAQVTAALIGFHPGARILVVIQGRRGVVLSRWISLKDIPGWHVRLDGEIGQHGVYEKNLDLIFDE